MPWSETVAQGRVATGRVWLCLLTIIALTGASATGAQTLNLVDRTLSCQSSPLLGLSQNIDAPTTSQVVQSADRFRVPDGPEWRIDLLRVRGTFDGSDVEAQSVDVTIYDNQTGGAGPDQEVCQFPNISLDDLGPQVNQGNFEIALADPDPTVQMPSDCSLPPGDYWASVVFNGKVEGDPSFGRFWYWDQSSDPLQGRWQMRASADINGSGISCPNWVPREQCSTVSQQTGLCFGLAGNTKVTRINPLADQFTSPGTSFLMDVSVAFSDPDGDTVTYEVSGLPDSLSLDGVNGRISGTITTADAANSPYTVTVIASDEDGFADQGSFSLLVADNEVSEFRFQRLWPVLQQPWYFGTDAPDIAFNGKNLFVANATFSRIQRFSPLGLHISNLFIEGPGGPGTVGKPRIIAATSKAVYTVGDLDPQVHLLKTDGTLVRKFGGPQLGGQVPQFIAATERGCRKLGGCVYVGLPDRVLKFGAGGEFLTSFGQCTSAPCGNGTVQALGGLAADDSGTVYLTDQAEHQLVIVRSGVDEAISAAPTLVLETGSFGAGNGQFQTPGDVALDATGRVYVVDAVRVQAFSEAGVFLDDYQVNNPARAIVRLEMGLGNVGFAANDLGQVARFRRVGDVDAGLSDFNLSTPYASGDDSPGFFRGALDLSSGPNSNMYVLDAGNFRIQKFDPSGQLLDGYGGQGVADGEFLNMIAIDAKVVNGGLLVYVLDDDGDGTYRIQRFDNNGNFVDRIDLPSGSVFVDLVVTSSGNAFLVSDLGEALKIAPDGSVLAQWTSEGISGEFRQVTVAPNGLLYFTVQGVSQEGFEIYDRFGNFVQFLPATFTAPSAIAIAPDGKIVLGEIPDVAPDVPRIKIYRQDGVLLQSVGQYGYFPGSFAAPAGITFAPNGLLYVVDSTNNNVQVLNPIPAAEKTRVVIVAGGGPYPGNNLWDTTQSLANGAYLALAYQGLSGDDIMYLSSNPGEDLDGNGIPDVDAAATPMALQNAITSWGADADRLVIYLADHGSQDTFRMSPSATLDASQLAQALNQVQSGANGVGQTVVIYDACRAGSFIDDLANPSLNRIVLASTGADQSAKYVSDGLLSFSTQFWTRIFTGSDLADAYTTAAQIMTTSFADQTPLADADGDGTGNESMGDLDALSGIFIGAGTSFEPGSPTITSVSAPQILASGGQTQVSAFGVTDPDGVARVYADIIPPNYVDDDLDQPLQSFPGFELESDGPGSDDYTLDYDGFTSEGVYVVNVYAQDRFGNISAPVSTTVTAGNPPLRKALIVVGGETSDGQWPAYSSNGELAFAALTAQGYSDVPVETVRYLSNGSADGVDVAANEANLAAAFDWAGATNNGVQTQDVVVFLVGGVRSGQLRLANGQRLGRPQLAAYLDTLEAAISGKLVVVYEGNQSGSFLPALATVSTDKRLLIASAAANQQASFLLGGTLSFSQFFWNQVLLGDTVLEAFEAATDAVSFASAGQTPQLDDNSNGEGNDAGDGFLAGTYAIGAGIVQDPNGPTLGTLSPDVTLTDGSVEAVITADNVLSTGTVEQVFGVVTTPAPQRQSDTFVLNPVDVDAQGNGEYSGTYDGFGPLADGGYAAGIYTVAVYARDSRGNIAFQNTVSVQQTRGPDGWEADNSRAAASPIFVDDADPQQHTLHATGERDFVAFSAVNSPAGQGNPAQIYEIRASNVDNFSGAGFNLQLAVIGTSGNVLASATGGVGGSLSLTWPGANQDYDEGEGTYYVRVRAQDPEQLGQYQIQVFRPDVLLTGLVRGSVVDALTEAPVAGALISSNGSVAAVTNAAGDFQLAENPGTYDLVVTPPAGYEMLTESAVPVVESLTTWRLLRLQPSGVPPTVATGPAQNVAQETATLTGTVSPNGDATSITFSILEAVGNITQPQDLAAGAALTDVMAAVDGLTCATTYNYRISASNSNGSSDGDPVQFTTADCVPPPTVAVLAVADVTDSTATLTAQVDAMGSDTTSAFRWGPVGGVLSDYVDSGQLVSGSGSQQVSLMVDSLVCETRYEYQARAVNAGGLASSALLEFDTGACPQVPPLVITLPAAAVSDTQAELQASVDPRGAVSAVEYRLAAQGEPDGAWLSAGNVAVAGTVTVPVSGLDCGRNYRYRFRATNSGGTAQGADQTFDTNACPAEFPQVTTGSATMVGQTTATLNATVDPNSSATTVTFDLGFSEVYTEEFTLDAEVSGDDPIAVAFNLTGLACNRQYHFRARGSNAAGSAFGGDQIFSTNPCDRILLVDDDDNQPDVLGSYSAALDSLGFEFETFSTGGGDTEPDLTVLESYSTVIWFTGNNAGSGVGPGAAAEGALGTYLDQGGCLAISSQDYFSVRGSSSGPTALMTRYLGLAGGASDVDVTQVRGVSQDFVGLPANGSYLLDFGAAGLTPRPDTLTPDATAGTAFEATAPAAGAAVAVQKHTPSYRTMFLSFPLPAVPDATERAAGLSAILDYCRAADLSFRDGFEND